ncbi:hypothetical protein Salat_1687600 [Sesamum alatum]|uniref:Uncharacterized protein n=1 Tax=Sesamum alatum TaxID=300844 RepID=A0AAE2CJY4_9LAMI|nr:hypothetical protein Salat_1687600 [Sesamum alatum]
MRTEYCGVSTSTPEVIGPRTLPRVFSVPEPPPKTATLHGPPRTAEQVQGREEMFIEKVKAHSQPKLVRIYIPKGPKPQQRLPSPDSDGRQIYEEPAQPSPSRTVM